MKISLKIKAICVVLTVAVVLAIVSVAVSYNIYSQTMDEHYRTMAMNLAETEAAVVDSVMVRKLQQETMEIYREICRRDAELPDFDHFTDEEWESYYQEFETVVRSAAYADTIERLHDIAAANDVMSIYICYMDAETGKAVYIVDGSTAAEACRTGNCDNIEEGNRLLMQKGIYDFPAYITNYDEYGWLCSASAAIYDKDGNVIGNAYVDISMDQVMRDRNMFLVKLVLGLAAASCLLVVLLFLAVNRTVVGPINVLASAAASFVSDKKRGGADGGTSAIARLKVQTGDEIEKLADSVQTMEKEINTYIDNLTAVTAEKERIGAELNVATQIQADMLPNIFPAFPEHDEFDVYASMAPAREVGGDFYDFFMVDNRHLAIVMADVSGKGVPAALFMVIAKTLIKNHAQNREEPACVFTNVNSQLCENNEVGMFVTGWIGVLDIDTGKLVYANAGHNYPLAIRRDGTVEWIKNKPGFVLAGMENVKYRQYEMTLEKGDTIFLYTDGVTEALNSREELFGEERLMQAVSAPEVRVMRPEKLLPRIARDLKDFVGDAEQADDITMLALYRNAKGENGSQWKELRVRAKKEDWRRVSAFLEEQLENLGCSMKIQTQLLIASEEIFVNIASYAYGEAGGNVVVRTRVKDGGIFHVCFEDSGVPYNPLEKQDPDILLKAEEREIGGLGIMMVKKSMDDIRYEYTEGRNRLTMIKAINF